MGAGLAATARTEVSQAEKQRVGGHGREIGRSACQRVLEVHHADGADLEGFVERLFLTPALVTIAIVLMRFAFRIAALQDNVRSFWDIQSMGRPHSALR
jgi:hypothetical protein